MGDETICYCKNVRKSQIIDAINKGAKSLTDVQKITNACTGNKCKELNPKKRCCIKEVNKILKEFNIKNNKSCCGGECC